MRRRTRFSRVAVAALAAATVVAVTGTAQAGESRRPEPPKLPTAQGFGGAVSTVDPTATKVGLDVLRRGGNAVDAAVAAAAALGVTEPFSAGIGGGGFFVYYDAATQHVYTIDGRETAPQSMGENAFVNPATGAPLAFQEARVSGLSVGVPGTLMTWSDALTKWGTTTLAEALRPATRVAQRGFTVDATFRQQVADNAAVFGQFDSTREIYLPGGQPPAVGSTLRNRDLAATYRAIGQDGIDAFYKGAIGADMVAAVQNPPVSAEPAPWPSPIRPGGMTVDDLASYATQAPAPIVSEYRGYEIYGMNTPSSGGIAVAEALNILEQFDVSTMSVTEALHHYLEASALTYADRNRYVGANTSRRIVAELVSDRYAVERACQINPTTAAPKPVAPGSPDGVYDASCPTVAPGVEGNPGQSTTNLTVADRWGNVVEYTLTIEQTGGSGIVVPGRGFLLNNELTDFTFQQSAGAPPDPNLPAPGKRPRSSMAPTIVLEDGKPFLALGTPGGATIITTVLQMLVNRIDLGMTLPEAMAAPRASQRNSGAPQAEPAFITAYGSDLSATYKHPTFVSTAELGAATAIEMLGTRGFVATAEPVRRGGGAAGVVMPVG